MFFFRFLPGTTSLACQTNSSMLALPLDLTVTKKMLKFSFHASNSYLMTRKLLWNINGSSSQFVLTLQSPPIELKEELTRKLESI